jgi:hypothetical protein
MTEQERTDMRTLRNVLPVGLAIAIFILTVPSLSAATASFTGTFTRDNEVQLFNFTVVTPALVGLATTSYAGGGFSPVLSLFDAQSDGLLIGRDDGVDHANGEASLSLLLPSGLYFVALTQFDNLAVGPKLSNGFLQQGNPTFTSAFGSPGISGPFLNIDGLQRNGNFALTVSNIGVASLGTPEPDSLLLVGLGAMGIFLGILRFQKRPQ